LRDEAGRIAGAYPLALRSWQGTSEERQTISAALDEAWRAIEAREEDDSRRATLRGQLRRALAARDEALRQIEAGRREVGGRKSTGTGANCSSPMHGRSRPVPLKLNCPIGSATKNSSSSRSTPNSRRKRMLLVFSSAPKNLKQAARALKARKPACRMRPMNCANPWLNLRP
jgi:hypothetical protein